MPKASAPKAPWVQVWLSPHTTSLPGRVSPCSGPSTWAMPVSASLTPKWGMPHLAAPADRRERWMALHCASPPVRPGLEETTWSGTA